MSDFDWELSDKTMERIRNRHRAFAKNHPDHPRAKKYRAEHPEEFLEENQLQPPSQRQQDSHPQGSVEPLPLRLTAASGKRRYRPLPEKEKEGLIHDVLEHRRIAAVRFADIHSCDGKPN